MPTTIYFSGSISAGRDDLPLYQRIVRELKADGHRVLAGSVAAAHIGDDGDSGDPRAIFRRDIGWIEEAADANGILIAETSKPSLGVGYEIAAARYRYGIPVICLYRSAYTKRLSAMIGGDAGIVTLEYADLDEVLPRLRAAIARISDPEVALTPPVLS